MESQLELLSEFMKEEDKFRQALPGLMAIQDTIREKIYNDGALSRKMKRLIALGIALRVPCTECIIGQTKYAVEAGATKDEILETISVAVAMGGTTGIAESLRVVKLLEELGKW